MALKYKLLNELGITVAGHQLFENTHVSQYKMKCQLKLA